MNVRPLITEYIQNNEENIREYIVNQFENENPDSTKPEKAANEVIKELKEAGKYWHDNFSNEHYLAAVEYLRELDEVLCVKTSNGAAYQGGEFWVHTNYANEMIVEPLITLLDMNIRGVTVKDPDSDTGFECVQEHGKCLEINMGAQTPCRPIPVEDFIQQTQGKNYWIHNSKKEQTKVFNATFD